MARVIDHGKKYRILEEAKVKYPCPDLDSILPPKLDVVEESMTEDEFDAYVTKKFGNFFSKYVNARTKEFFVYLPLEFFTPENVERVKEYANIAFFIKVDNARNGKDFLNLPTSQKYWEDLHEKFLKILFQRKRELIAQNAELEKN